MPSEDQHKCKIGRSFALGATSVTKEQFLRFQPTFSHDGFPHYYPEPTCPIGGVTWYEAAAYCNWISKEEGIPEEQWCYEIKGNEIKLKANYLSRSGYRLPTEAEMEYATRAGAITSRYFGETENLLANYAVYTKNSSGNASPVGSRKPNDWGLFDAHGNMWTWCQEGFKPYPEGEEAANDKEDDDLVVSGTRSCVVRGGSYENTAANLRSAVRYRNVPPYRVDNPFGFRLARTLPLGGFTALPLPAEGGSK